MVGGDLGEGVSPALRGVHLGLQARQEQRPRCAHRIGMNLKVMVLSENKKLNKVDRVLLTR